MPAILFGSISSLADTSELQRAAFNSAFRTHGLDWNWGQDEYRALLTGNGGRQRVADYALDRGAKVDAHAVHETKSQRFRDSLAGAPLFTRPGVDDTIAAAKDAGWRLGLVTTTSGGNIDALLSGLEPQVSRTDFDVVVDVSSVDEPKPSGAAYEYALEELGEPASACIAIEDNLGGVASARAAGITVVAFANQNTAGHDFGDTRRVTRLNFADLVALVPSVTA